MKTILKIKETWDAAPTLPEKDVLVAKASGWKCDTCHEGFEYCCPDCGSFAHAQCDGTGGRTGSYTFKKPCVHIPHYTTDPAAVLQAMKDVGIYDRFEYVLIVHSKTGNNHWIEIDNPPSPWTQIKDYKHSTLELACGFAVYTFSELKEGKNDEN